MSARRKEQPQRPRIDVDALEARLDLLKIVAERMELKREGHEWVGRCPFHDEDTPSFKVNPAKGFVHCFGCGAHHKAVGFVMRFDGIDFLTAVRLLDAGTAYAADKPRQAAPARVTAPPEWTPILPVPADAPPLRVRGRARVWNPKTQRWSLLQATRYDAYRDAEGRLLGYVLRLDFEDKKVITTATYCRRGGGESRWVLQAFPEPRPLQGLDALALQLATVAGPNGRRRMLMRVGEAPRLQESEWIERVQWPPVLIVEGEKCREAAARTLPLYAVVTWPGGTGGIHHADWSPLQGRDVVLWEDADDVGRATMRGRVDQDGTERPGVAQLAYAAGAASVRAIDTTGMQEGWDIADAVDPKQSAWSADQVMTWAVARVSPVARPAPIIEPSQEMESDHDQ